MEEIPNWETENWQNLNLLIKTSPGGVLKILTNRNQRSIFLGFESRMFVFLGYWSQMLYFFLGC